MVPRGPVRMAVREVEEEEEEDGVGSRPGPSLMVDEEAMGTMSPGSTMVMV